jgi:hypothetical protein
MGSRIVFSAIVALLALTAFAALGSAAESDKGNPIRPRSQPFRYQYGGYFGQIGGHYYGTVPERLPFLNGSTYNYPGYYNNQTFWERVVTQRNYPVQY